MINAFCCSVLQCIAVCLQCVAVRGIMLQCICSVWQCVAGCCSVLQRVAEIVLGNVFVVVSE